jgi:hypothetical protein
MAEAFWQVIPQRAQRRLQELLRTAPLGEYDALTEAAHQSGRRVGLFLSGDFGVTARALLSERMLSVESRGAGILKQLCTDVPGMSDLFRLAVSPEYAEARWHPLAPQSQRGSISSTRFSIV